MHVSNFYSNQSFFEALGGKEAIEGFPMYFINYVIVTVVCDPPCQNDAPCVANDTCNCNTGFTGPTCDGTLSITVKILYQEIATYIAYLCSDIYVSLFCIYSKNY